MERGRTVHVGVAIALAVVAAGFVTGVRGSADARVAVTSVEPQSGGAPTARSYADERNQRYGPNAAMYEGAFDKLAARPDVNTPVEQTPEERVAALARRASRRAFDGAPPTIPHRVMQMGPLDCAACHGTGITLGGVVAPKVSHELYQSCTQCHVTSEPAAGGAPQPKPDNAFSGVVAWGKGSRAWAGAPPTIPHPTLMRSDCSSCHGVLGAQGLKTPHPARQSCTQCHVSDANNDQHPGAK